MEQPKYILKPGTKVITHDPLQAQQGIFVKQKHLNSRRPNAEGTIIAPVGGHGGDVYWVEHDKASEAAAYCFDEFELIENADQLPQRNRPSRGPFLVTVDDIAVIVNYCRGRSTPVTGDEIAEALPGLVADGVLIDELKEPER